MDIYEFAGKLAEQHASLLKVIELQNNSIQALNHRLNALAASQLIVFALLSENDERPDIAKHLRLMLDNPNISGSQYLVAQLRELLEVCEDSRKSRELAPHKPAPSWLKGVVEGGLSKTYKDK